MNDIKLFTNESFGQVRVIDRNGDPWFVAKDVCECLGLANVSMACDRLDEDEKSNICKTDVGLNTGVYNFANGGRAPIIVSESGLYSLVLCSNKPEAKAFKRWITHEVIPSIRKTGAYQLAPRDYAEALRALANEVEQKQLAIQQRDEAIRTKYHFVEGRDAEMCGRVGGLTAQNERLKERLGDATNWKQAKAVTWLYKYYKRDVPMGQIGKVLTNISNELGIETRTAEDSTWGVVKVYHITAINRFKELLDAGEDILPKYRRWEG